MVAQFVCVYYSRETILTVLDNLDPKLIPFFFFLPVLVKKILMKTLRITKMSV